MVETEENPTPTPVNPEFSARMESPTKSHQISVLPFILGAIVLAGIIVCAVIFGGADEPASLSNNIDDSNINWSTYSDKEITLSESIKITDPGTYTLTGSISDGMVEVNTSGVVKLILNGVSIVNSSGPAILVSEAKTVVVETAAGTENFLKDSSTYSLSDEDIVATLFSKDDLVLQGSGTLTVEGNYADGIVSKDDLKLVSGTYNIATKDDALRGRDSVYIVGGTLAVTSGGDAIKSNNSEGTGKGYIKIDDGNLTLSAGDDGIHAESSLEINGGTITIEKSYEGLEAANITINGGTIAVTASDDGLNAAGGNDSSSPNMSRFQGGDPSKYSIVINGGTLSVDAVGDGIDSNGSLTLNGGIVRVDGPTNNGNGALDAESDVTYNAGTVIALGASGMAVAPSASTSSGYSASVYFEQTYPAGTIVRLCDSTGTTLLEHTSKKTFSHVSLSSPSLTVGVSYTLYLNDEEYSTFSLSDKTTRLGGGIMSAPAGTPAGPGNRRF